MYPSFCMCNKETTHCHLSTYVFHTYFIHYFISHVPSQSVVMMCNGCNSDMEIVEMSHFPQQLTIWIYSTDVRFYPQGPGVGAGFYSNHAGDTADFTCLISWSNTMRCLAEIKTCTHLPFLDELWSIQNGAMFEPYPKKSWYKWMRKITLRVFFLSMAPNISDLMVNLRGSDH